MSRTIETLILTASEVSRCLPASECREALARELARFAEGGVPPPRSLGFDARDGGFHAKAALVEVGLARFVTKVNGNFPGNPERHGLPTIQGVVVLADATDGRPLAVLDSASVTAIRTAAASAVAAGVLARPDASVAAVVGCGRQGTEHVEALLAVRPLREIRLYDVQASRAEQVATRFHGRNGLVCLVVGSAAEAALGADLVATCTTGSEFVLGAGDVSPGTFVAAVGADYPRKREIHPSLMARARVVVDDLEQCASGGDLHHALAAGVLRREDVQADLGSVVLGTRRGREHDDDVVVFDSTGIALEDVVAADIAYERALELGVGRRVSLGS
jgi:ornithine cyclodeaminase/alanine dehydrogenase-like protein (mu-crystallin family)